MVAVDFMREENKGEELLTTEPPPRDRLLSAGTPSSPWIVTISDPCRRLDWAEIFKNDHPVELDLGAGDGGFALAYARAHPECNLFAVERLLGRIRKLEKRARRQGLTNLRGLRLELGYTVRYLLPPHSISVAHLMFPDPWPKRRHWSRRLIGPSFVEDLLKALRPGGEIRFTTDHADYFTHATAVMARFDQLISAPLWSWQEDPPSDFQQTFEIEGRPALRARWITAC